MYLISCMLATSPEAILAQMTLEEKIGQLFVVPACPMRGDDHFSDLRRLMERYHIGSVIVKQASDPFSQKVFLDTLQNLSKLPLLVAADYEWGLVMTVKNAKAYPKAGILGKTASLEDIRWIAQEIGQQAVDAGVDLNLAPVADVNNNPQNPIIRDRSFGDTSEKVSDCMAAFIQGLHEGGCLACAKHFPGHGDTTVDSHLGLPSLPHSQERLWSLELLPFIRSVAEKVDFVMIGHLLVPAIDPDYPATLSKIWIRDILKGEMGFQGLVIADALNMQALVDCYSVEEIALLGREAGLDLLLYGAHISERVDDLLRDAIPRAYAALLQAYQEERLSRTALDATVLKILTLKKSRRLH